MISHVDDRRCVYATDPTGRPHCQLTAVIRYGTVPLCADCDQQRSTLGKGQPPRPLPAGPQIDPIDWISTAHDDLRAATQVLHAAVTRARQRGHPWSLIARTLRVSRQAAQQRFSDPQPTIPRRPPLP
jgi:hypothetical protein